MRVEREFNFRAVVEVPPNATHVGGTHNVMGARLEKSTTKQTQVIAISGKQLLAKKK